MRQIFLFLLFAGFLSWFGCPGCTDASANSRGREPKGDDLTRLFDMDLLLMNMERCGAAGREDGSSSLGSWKGRAHRSIEEHEDIIAKSPAQSRNSELDEVAEAHFILGMVLGFEKDEPRHALEHLDRFLSLYASSRDRRVLQAAEAMCLIEPFARSGKMEDEALPQLISEAVKIGNPSKRIERLSLIASFHPYSPLPLYVMGQLYEGEGKRGLAIEILEQSIELRPTCAPCHEALGRILIEKKQEEEGKMHLSKADLFNPQLDKFLSNEKINK